MSGFRCYELDLAEDHGVTVRADKRGGKQGRPSGVDLTIDVDGRHVLNARVGFADAVRLARYLLDAADGVKFDRVYYIRCGDLVKIGYSNDPAARLRSLQTGSPSRLELMVTEPGGRAVESARHEQFSDWRTEGEWFMLVPEVLEHLRALGWRDEVDPKFSDAEELGLLWARLSGESVDDTHTASFVRWLDALSFEVIRTALLNAASKGKPWAYVCGICWKKFKKETGVAYGLG